MSVEAAPAKGQIQILSAPQGEQARVLSKEATEFLANLSRKFEARRQELLARRMVRQQEIDAGRLPDFLPETAKVREQDWRVAPVAVSSLQAFFSSL